MSISSDFLHIKFAGK